MAGKRKTKVKFSTISAEIYLKNGTGLHSNEYDDSDHSHQHRVNKHVTDQTYLPYTMFILKFRYSVDPDQMLQNAASDQGLHCLPLTHKFLHTSQILN